MPERRDFDPFRDDYQEMSNIAASYALIFITESATVFICVVKSLKFFALQKDLMLLQMTLGQAFKDLLVFVAMTIILFVGFVVMGLNIFGMQAPSYNTILNTLGTLFLILLGEFDYAEMNAVSRIWAIIVSPASQVLFGDMRILFLLSSSSLYLCFLCSLSCLTYSWPSSMMLTLLFTHKIFGRSLRNASRSLSERSSRYAVQCGARGATSLASISSNERK